MGVEVGMEKNNQHAKHKAKKNDKAEASALLLPTDKHRVSPLHSPDLLRKTLASAQTGWPRLADKKRANKEIPCLPAGRQRFRMRTFEERGDGEEGLPCYFHFRQYGV